MGLEKKARNDPFPAGSSAMMSGADSLAVSRVSAPGAGKLGIDSRSGDSRGERERQQNNDDVQRVCHLPT